MWATDTDSGFIYLEDGDVYGHMSDVGATVEVVEFNKANPIRVQFGRVSNRPCLQR